MDDHTAFLPFNAINEFMRPDFRLSVIREALAYLSSAPKELSDLVNRLTRKTVSVPGFRNSEKAPLLMKVIPASKAFEKSPEFVSALLALWAESQPEFKDQVYHLLLMRNWKHLETAEQFDISELSKLIESWAILPVQFDRKRLPGFYPHWPKGEDFETLYQHFSEMYPNVNVGIDKVSLMAVWLSMRLPYHVDDESIHQDQSHS